MSASRATVVFLHGALGVSSDLAPLMQLVAEKGLQTLTFNFSGHGEGTHWPQEFRIELFARELDQYLKQHKLEDVTIFGHSMGGYVALFHKAHFEDSPISQIFTYGTKFNWSESSVARELPMLDPENLAQKFPNFAETLIKKHGQERWKMLLLSTAHLMNNLERLDGLTREDLNDLEIPVVLMLGDQDRMVTTEETHLTRSWMPGSEVKIIAHSKHEMERANLREIAGVILESII